MEAAKEKQTKEKSSFLKRFGETFFEKVSPKKFYLCVLRVLCGEKIGYFMKANKILDCIGLFCPMPITQTKIETDKMKKDEVLEILADDPGFLKDLPAWCKMSGEEFLGMEKDGNILKGYIKKRGV